MSFPILSGGPLGNYTESARTSKTHNRKFETNIPRKELRGYSPNSYIHVSVSDLQYIHLIGLPILLQENRWTERGTLGI